MSASTQWFNWEDPFPIPTLLMPPTILHPPLPLFLPPILLPYFLYLRLEGMLEARKVCVYVAGACAQCYYLQRTKGGEGCLSSLKLLINNEWIWNKCLIRECQNLKIKFVNLLNFSWKKTTNWLEKNRCQWSELINIQKTKLVFWMLNF